MASRVQLMIQTFPIAPPPSIYKKLFLRTKKAFQQKRQIHSIIQCTKTEQHQYRPRHPPNYQPTTSWSYEFIDSITNQNHHLMEVEEENMKKMEEEVRSMLENESVEPLRLIELIDDIHRLGLGYKFQDSTNRALGMILLQFSHELEQKIHKNLHACALYFRLLRQHGYQISTDIFESFIDSNGKFSASLAMDARGMLSLYEASHLAFDGESTLDEAGEFTSFHLKNMMNEMDTKSALLVSHALELPLHYRMQRLEARWNIEMYDHNKLQNKDNQLLHKLAVLDFNMVQSQYQADLQEVSRWWRHVGLADNLSFARDRVMESFFWAIGMVFEPQFSKCHIGLTKVVKLLTVLDDIYDVYGSVQELQQLTEAVHKWDVSCVKDLPDYMRLSFFAIYNTINDLAYDTLKEQDRVVISQVRQVWTDLCKAWLREAKWREKKHIPKFEEYMNHGWISSSSVVLLTHAYLLTAPTLTDEALTSFTHHTNALLRFPSSIFRLANDISSSQEDVERGAAKAVPCYMHESGASHQVGRACMNNLIEQNWKMINYEICYNSIFDTSYIYICCNLARIAMCQYQHGGDAHTAPTHLSTNRIKSVVIDPIQFFYNI